MGITNLSDDKELGSTAGLSTAEKREIIRQSLSGLASEVSMLIRDAGLTFPILFCIPNSGNALLSMTTPLDPSEAEWTEATAVACAIIARLLGGIRLCSLPLECAMANSTMSAADVIVDAMALP